MTPHWMKVAQDRIGVTPPWMKAAQEQLGVAETPGPKSTPKILAWAKALGSKLGIAYPADSVPWCGLFVGMCIQAAQLDPPKIAIRAKSWAAWGGPLPYAVEGAILVFERAGGGHVGFYAGETSTAYRVLGGNQSDRVSYTWIAKPRCVAIRWPTGVLQTTTPIRLTQAGELSRNEA